jgi:NifU-like protein
MRPSLATCEPTRAPLTARRSGVGKAGSRACGNAIEVRLTLEEHTEVISELSVETRGHQLPGDPTGLEALFVGLTVQQALEVSHREIAHRLGGLPESKMYCSVLLHEALRSAVGSACQREDMGERPHRPCVTCRCFTVAEDLIRRAVRVNRLTSLEQVAGYTRAGSGCGLCTDGIATILASANGEWA